MVRLRSDRKVSPDAPLVYKEFKESRSEWLSTPVQYRVDRSLDLLKTFA